VAVTGRTVLVQLNSLSLGGTQISAVDFAAALVPHGYTSVLIGPRDTIPRGPSLFEVAAERGVHLEAVDRPESVVAGARDLARRAREISADVVHVYGSWGARPAYWGPCRLGRRPLVQTVYEMAVAPWSYQAVPLVVGTGYLVDDLRDRRGLTTLISPPVDLEHDRPGAVDPAPFVASLGLAAGRVRAVIVSRLDEEMKALSVEIAIQAVGRLRRPDLDLVVVGTGDAEERLRALGDAVNDELGRRAVVFAGPLPDPRVAYASADVVLGMGSSAARALAFGKPLIVQGENGWSRRFLPESADALYRNSFWSDEASAAAVDELAENLAGLGAVERAALGPWSREFAVAHFDLEAMAARLAAVYAAAASSYGVRSWLSDLGPEVRAVRASRFSPTQARGTGAVAPGTSQPASGAVPRPSASSGRA